MWVAFGLKLLLAVMLCRSIAFTMRTSRHSAFVALCDSVAADVFESDGGDAIEEFIQLFESSLRRETFASVSLSSRKVPSKGPIDLASMRGAALSSEKGQENQMMKGKKAEVMVTEDLIRVDGRLIKLKAGVHVQLNGKYKTNDQAKNFAIEGGDASKEMNRLLKKGSFKRAELSTENANYQLTMSKSNNNLKVKAAKNIVPKMSETTHDRKKNLPIDPKSRFLQALGVVNKEGRPLSGMKAKLRQIERFVEILAGLVDKACAQGEVEKARTDLMVTDMGSGLAYLTFATHSYFTEKSRSADADTDTGVFATVRTIGVENRLSLVDKTNRIARELGTGFEGLSFRHASIEELHKGAGAKGGGPYPDGPDGSNLNVLIALHACDTATDDAIYQGIASGADIIVTAPCCHKQLRPQLDAPAVQETSAVLCYGIYRERLGEMVTDTMRAKCLEASGYDVTVSEFIGGAHTAKNVMIAAVKRARTPRQEEEGDEDGAAQGARAELASLSSSYRVHSHKLVSLLGMDGVLTEAPATRRTRASSRLVPRAKG